MSIFYLIPPPLRPSAIALVLLSIAGAAAGSAWAVQDWRYGQALAEKVAQAATEGEARAVAVTAALTAEQSKRVALEGRLKVNDETHYRELSDAKSAKQRLSDRLATADVRLSVLLAAPIGAGADGVPAAASAGGVVHGATRAELDPAHAQRIIGITGDGDEGLTALAACQGYVRAVWAASQRSAPP